MTSGRTSPPPSGNDRGPKNTPSSVPHFSKHGSHRKVSKPSKPTENARLFVQVEYHRSGENLLAFHRGKFRTWNGSWWQILDEADLRSKIVRFFEHAYFTVNKDDRLEEVAFDPTPTRVTQIVETLKSLTNKGTDRLMPSWPEVDHPIKPEEILSVANGLVYLPLRVLLPPTPVFFNAFSLPYDYEEDAPIPERWLRFLDELFGDDEKGKQLLQEWMGYELTPDTSQQKILLMVGPMRSGKGTIGKVNRALLGDHNVAGPTLSGLCTNFGMQPLVDKPVAIISDARLGKGRDSATAVERLLSISGEDALTVDVKYKSPYTVKLPTRLIIMTNEVPALADSSGALASRFLTLRLTESFLGREDPGLFNELLSELPGILLWALEGRERLYDRGYFIQPESGRAIIDDLVELSSPVTAFVEERCVVGPDHVVPIPVLFEAWKHWCDGNNLNAGSKKAFGVALRSAYPHIEDRRGSGTPRIREYVGIGLA